jgi:hypothetical protein
MSSKILKLGTFAIPKIGSSNLMGFTPPPIPLTIPDCALFLNNTTASMILSGTNRISQWGDLSGNGRNFIQATGVNQPLYTANVVNNQGGIFFADNTAQRLVSSFSSNIASGNTIIIVWSQQAPRSRDFYVFDGVDNSGNRNLMQYDSDLYSFRGSLATLIPSMVVNPAPLRVSYIENNTTASASKYFQNNVQIGSNFNNGTGAINGLTLGNRFTALSSQERTLNGYIHEVIIYSREITSGERATLQTYFNTKYAL